MKKVLFGILTFLGIGLSFCSAGLVSYSPSYSFDDYLDSDIISGSFSLSSDYYINNICFPRYYNASACSNFDVSSVSISKGVGSYYFSGNSYFCINVFDTLSNGEVFNYSFSFSNYCNGFGADGRYPIRLYDYGFFTDSPFPIFQNLSDGGTINFINGYFKPYYYVSFPTLSLSSLGGGSSSSDITVYYNSGSSTNITCDGVQAIQINGLSTITSTNTFTPYYNISYTDEDNQKLIESYSKDILYLSGGLFKKTYTGDNERILTDTIESPNSSFSGYLPTFEITGSVDPNDEFTGNVFNNFAENSLKFTLSNIPSYIQYVILLFILFFILGFIRKFRRK